MASNIEASFRRAIQKSKERRYRYRDYSFAQPIGDIAQIQAPGLSRPEENLIDFHSPPPTIVGIHELHQEFSDVTTSTPKITESDVDNEIVNLKETLHQTFTSMVRILDVGSDQEEDRIVRENVTHHNDSTSDSTNASNNNMDIPIDDQIRQWFVENVIGQPKTQPQTRPSVTFANDFANPVARSSSFHQTPQPIRPTPVYPSTYQSTGQSGISPTQTVFQPIKETNGGQLGQPTGQQTNDKTPEQTLNSQPSYSYQEFPQYRQNQPQGYEHPSQGPNPQIHYGQSFSHPQPHFFPDPNTRISQTGYGYGYQPYPSQSGYGHYYEQRQPEYFPHFEYFDPLYLEYLNARRQQTAPENQNYATSQHNKSTQELKIFKYYNDILPIFEKGKEENPQKFLKCFDDMLQFANLGSEMKAKLFRNRIRMYNYDWERNIQTNMSFEDLK